MKKYELFKKEGNLWRIRRISDGLVGGLIEKEENLSHDGDCFVYENAKVYGNAKVKDNAKIYGFAEVYDNAQVFGNSKVYGNAQIYHNAKVFRDSKIYDFAEIYEDALVSGNTEINGNAEIRFNVKSNDDFIVIGKFGENNRYVTINVSEKKIVCGCFYGTFEKFEKEIFRKYYGMSNYYTLFKILNSL